MKYIVLFIIYILLYFASKLVVGIRPVKDFIVILGLAYYCNTINNQNYNIIYWYFLIMLIYFSIFDIIWIIRYFLISIGLHISIFKKLITTFVKYCKLLKEEMYLNLYIVSEVILIFSIIFIFCIQYIFHFPHINFMDKSLIDILGFVVAILSLYGIYIAFIQFLLENDNLYHFGVSKFRFILDRSLWSNLTKTKTFYFLLFCLVFLPIIRKINNDFFDKVKDIEYFWHTCYLLFITI